MSSKQHTTRISAGSLRYQVIKQPGEGTRPVAQRTREAIFNVLGDDLTGLTVLDLFAGSGALGFEALSRGAASAVFVEQSAGVCRLIHENARELGVEAQVEVFQGASEKFLADKSTQYDLVFLDPPYADFHVGLLNDVASVLHQTGVMIVSCSKTVELPERVDQQQLIKQKVYGDTRIGYYK